LFRRRARDKVFDGGGAFRNNTRRSVPDLPWCLISFDRRLVVLPLGALELPFARDMLTVTPLQELLSIEKLREEELEEA
jgi:hypothetical protein